MSGDELRWLPVGEPAQWHEGQGRLVQLGARRLAVFLHQGRFSALKDACPHAGVSLAGGAVADGCVICPAHAWRFRLEDGACASNAAARAVAYPVRISNGRVEVGIP